MPTRYPPIDIEIASSLLPYTDLDLKGDPQRNLRIPNDVIVALAGIIGLYKNIPRMAQMSAQGALYVTEAGGGTNNWDSIALVVNVGPPVTFDFSQYVNPIYLCTADGPFLITITDPLVSNPTTFELLTGFQVMLPVTARSLLIDNLGGAAGTIVMAGFFNDPNVASLIV